MRDAKVTHDLDIAEVARRSGVPASTLRYYEERGLIAPIGRRGLRRLFDAGVLERLALIGLGSAVFGPPNTSTIMGSVPRRMLGTASASVATSRNVGNAVGLAVGSAVLVIVGGSAAGVSAEDLPTADLLRGIQAAFFVAGCLSLLAIFASLARGSQLPKPPTAEAPSEVAAR